MNNSYPYHRYGDISSYSKERGRGMVQMEWSQLSQETAHSSALHVPNLVKTYPLVGSLHQKGLSEYMYYILILQFLITIHRWMYALILAINANFQLKLKAKGYTSDPALSDGWAYWVESAPFRQYVDLYEHQVEVCICT